jgi:hypothetical protein
MQKASVPTIDSIVGDHILEVCIDTTCLLSTTTQKNCAQCIRRLATRSHITPPIPEYE